MVRREPGGRLAVTAEPPSQEEAAVPGRMEYSLAVAVAAVVVVH